MKILGLTQGRHAIIDDEDFKRVSQFKWHIEKRKSDKLYAFGQVGQWKSKKRTSLHRFIINPPSNSEVDHINGDPLDNRRSNLRIVTHAQNMLNKKIYKNNQIGIKGVYVDKGHYRAQIRVNKMKICLGSYDNLNEAHKAYMQAAKKYHGEFANLN